MTTADFVQACEFLLSRDIRIRTFVLLRPPGTTDQDGIARAIDSVRFAFDHGVNCCAVIPTRAGNGIMDQLQHRGEFEAPSLRSLETVVEETLCWNRGRVFADLWDVQQFSKCPQCVRSRVERLRQMNLTQMVLPPVDCLRCGGTSGR